jgi:predicted small lipoprotein YifL
MAEVAGVGKVFGLRGAWAGALSLRSNGDNMNRIVRNLVLAAGVALAVAACGKKGDLQRPLPPSDIAKDSKDATGKTPDSNRPFILDPLVK